MVSRNSSPANLRCNGSPLAPFKIALKIVPASWLECQLSSSNLSRVSNQANSKINFTELRDAAHLCLHITQILIEQVVDEQVVNLPEMKDQQLFNTLFEWFHDAHNAYQRQCSVTK